MPRRLGATTISRPLSDSTRHTSRNIWRSCSDDSTAWTIKMRSMDKSANGNSLSLTSAVRPGSFGGQCKTPWRAGMAATVRMASGRNRTKKGVV